MITDNYFTLDELTYSKAAKKNNIDNTPTSAVKANLMALRENILNPARRQLGSCIYVNSGYRSPQLNAIIPGASATSQHCTGEAADLDTRSLRNNQRLFEILVNLGNFDQLIWEGNGAWIHVSYKASGYNRHRILAQTQTGYTDITSTWQTYIRLENNL
ncbi:MAG: peptidase M15 [Paludibacteraceae bacterium]|nr:peptidase M15 [Paludibacteraceae bacterium]